MLNRLLLPTILLVLSIGFWASSNFQEIAAGVAIFLFGMMMLEDGFKLFSGGLLERALESATRSIPKSIGFGIFATTIMQSSSLVSVITISFLSAGLITLLAPISARQPVHGWLPALASRSTYRPMHCRCWPSALSWCSRNRNICAGPGLCWRGWGFCFWASTT